MDFRLQTQTGTVAIQDGELHLQISGSGETTIPYTDDLGLLRLQQDDGFGNKLTLEMRRS